MTTVALLFLVLPNVLRQILQTIFGYIEKSVDDGILRVVGLLAVVFGLALIYVGGLRRLNGREWDAAHPRD